MNQTDKINKILSINDLVLIFKWESLKQQIRYNTRVYKFIPFKTLAVSNALAFG